MVPIPPLPYTWDAGRLVREEHDYGPDGVVEEVGEYEYDGDQISAWAWDLDGDGAIDDSATFSWTPEGEGWSVVADGTDPNGWYRTEEWRDAALREVTYHYEDSTGLVVEWEVYDYATLGFSGSWASAWQQDGDVFLEESGDVTFDALGRLSIKVHHKAKSSGGRPSGEFTRTTNVLAYECP
jgi:hypothetical protein